MIGLGRLVLTLMCYLIKKHECGAKDLEYSGLAIVTVIPRIPTIKKHNDTKKIPLWESRIARHSGRSYPMRLGRF